MTGQWRRTWTGTGKHQGSWAEHLNGVEWGPIASQMSWLQRLICYPHRPQSRYYANAGLNLIEKCSCGRTRLDGAGPWKRKG